MRLSGISHVLDLTELVGTVGHLSERIDVTRQMTDRYAVALASHRVGTDRHALVGDGQRVVAQRGRLKTHGLRERADRGAVLATGLGIRPEGIGRHPGCVAVEADRGAVIARRAAVGANRDGEAGVLASRVSASADSNVVAAVGYILRAVATAVVGTASRLRACHGSCTQGNIGVAD